MPPRRANGRGRVIPIWRIVMPRDTTTGRFLPGGPSPAIARMWAKVHKTDGCWLWTGARVKNRYGVPTYGVIGVGTRSQGNIPVHVLSWQEAHGRDKPDGYDVCHACDVTNCVRPDHLFLGTRTDNMRDAASKRRTACGVQLPISKLTPEVVAEMRALNTTGVGYRKLAGLFGVARSTVRSAVLGLTWRRP